VDAEQKFNEGDRVILHYGIKGEFQDEDFVVKVHKNGRFRISDRLSTFRQDGREGGEDRAWGQAWVETWTPENEQKLKRHKLEIRAIQAANTFIQNISEVDSHKLEYVSAYLEDVNRKTIGE
jgi:hypothetical protein